MLRTTFDRLASHSGRVARVKTSLFMLQKLKLTAETFEPLVFKRLYFSLLILLVVKMRKKE